VKRPVKAIILCAGYGRRLSPLTNVLPKPMMPLWGVPIVERLMRMLRSWGVREVLLNMHHTAGPLLGHIRSRARDGLRVCASFEPAILGTGGALRRADWFIDADPFWVVNGDIAADVRPQAFLAAYRRLAPVQGIVWLHDKAGPRTVEMERGRVSEFRSSRAGSRGTYTFCGVQLVNPALLGYIPEQVFSSIVDAYEACLASGKRIGGVCPRNAFWADTGTVRGYLQVHRDMANDPVRFPDAVQARTAMLRRLAQAGACVAGFAAVGRDVAVAKGAHLRDTVLWDTCRIASDARIRGAVVASRTRASGRVENMALRLSDMDDPSVLKAVGRLRWPVASVTALPLPARGSARTFTRVQYGRRRAMVVAYSISRPENALYARQTRFLEGLGIHVPHVLVDLPVDNVLILSDMGDVSLSEYLRGRTRRELETVYGRVLAMAARLHGRGAKEACHRGMALSRPFSPSLCRWEHDLFLRHYAGARGLLSSAQTAAIIREVRRLARRVLCEPRVLLHRDLQSANVLIHRGQPVWIDFQGMRLGPALYDVASLLCDPYVSLAEDVQLRLLRVYAQQASVSTDGLESRFWLAAAQRLPQAIGAFGRLGGLSGTERFSDHIVPGLRMLARALERAEGLPYLLEFVYAQIDAEARRERRGAV